METITKNLRAMEIEPSIPMPVGVTPLGMALLEFVSQLSRWKRPNIRKSEGRWWPEDLWAGLMSVCKDPGLRKQFLSTLSSFQIISLRMVLLWKSGTVFLPESYSSQTSSEITMYWTKGSTLETLFLDEMSSHVPRPKDITRLIEKRTEVAEILVYCQLVRSYLDYTFNIKGSQSQKTKFEYLNLERQIQADSSETLLSSTGGSCHWLEDEQRRGLPRYLWDAWEQRTVKSQQVAGGRPKYLVVSHTWGRWMRKTPGLNMSPMVPWLVPENDLFSVQTLPAGLKQLAHNFGLRYIWLDLFCIPQNGSTEADKEISRQAIIFGGAVYAVVWFNTTETWDFLRQIISWMILETLRDKKLFARGFDVFDTHPCLKIAFEGLTQQLERKAIPVEYLDYCSARMDENLAPVSIPWFSSLWTLQEISLRPDMLLVNKNWEPLTIGHKTHVAIDTILYLTSMVFRSRHPVSAPPAIPWLDSLFFNSGIGHGFLKNPINLLNVASSRHCSRSRSEAIMSVLGCVDWHRKRKADRVHVESNALVSASGSNFWLYEFEFVLEVRQKYGFAFFFTKYGGRNFFMDVMDSKRPFGTILPFSGTALPDRLMPTGDTYPITDITGHPSVDDWTLLRDGSVKVNKVCILYQTSRAYSRHICELNPHIFEDACLIVGPPLKLRPKNRDLLEPYELLSLREWMDKFPTMSPLYAVVLCHGRNGGGTIDGFIFAEVPILTRLKDKVLAKLADFKLLPDFQMDFISRLPETEEVDWFIY